MKLLNPTPSVSFNFYPKEAFTGIERLQMVVSEGVDDSKVCGEIAYYGKDVEHSFVFATAIRQAIYAYKLVDKKGNVFGFHIIGSTAQ